MDISPFAKLPVSRFTLDAKPGISNESILEGDYDAILIRSTRKITREFIDKFKGKVIATFSKGTDHIDVDNCRKRGIKVFNSKTGNSTSAAEHTFVLILAASKNLLLADKLVRKNKFTELKYKRSELRDKKLGVIGYGSIGKKVSKFGKSFGMDVYMNDIDTKVLKIKKVNFKSLKFILSKCDVVTVHIPLTEKNNGFLDEEKLSLLKNNCIFVNTSRGEIVDENALINMLQKDKIGFVCLDVFKGEPDVNPLLFKFDNVILSNHIAGKTPESKILISEEVCNKLLKYYKV